MTDESVPPGQNDDSATTDETSDRVRDWLSAEPGVSVDGSTITVAGDPPITIGLAVDDERVTLTHERTEEGVGAGRADEIIAAFPERGTTLRATAAVDRTGVAVTLTNHVYVDGLSRQSMVAAFNEMVAGVDRIGAPAEGQQIEPDTETRVDEPVVEVDTEAPTTQQPVWTPTHTVPSGGMRAWSEPDPSLPPVSRLEAGVELTITEQRGDWANVLGSNGWTGWVDARRLGTVGSTPPSGGTNVGGIDLRPLPLLGGIALIVSAFLPWVARLGTSTNSMDVPLSFLWDFTSSGDPQLGWFVIGLGVIALALAVVRRPLPGALIAVGILSVAVAVAFVIQMYRGVSDFGGSSLFDWLGFAPWIALGAGILITAGSSTK